MQSLAILILAIGAASAQWPFAYNNWNPAWNGWNGWNGGLTNAWNWGNGFAYSSVAPALPTGRSFAYSALAPTLPAAAPAPALTYAPAWTKNQYHSQDALGQASYGYSYPGQASATVRDAAGNVRGSYAYIDPTGKEVRVNYVADAAGYRAESNALPLGPSHLPVPVQDTPEVQAARAEHARAFEAVKNRPGQQDQETHSRKKRSPQFLYSYPAATVPLTYSYPTYLHRPATLTSIVHTPGHSVSYRVD